MGEEAQASLWLKLSSGGKMIDLKEAIGKVIIGGLAIGILIMTVWLIKFAVRCIAKPFRRKTEAAPVPRNIPSFHSVDRAGQMGDIDTARIIDLLSEIRRHQLDTMLRLDRLETALERASGGTPDKLNAYGRRYTDPDQQEGAGRP
ncbi:hypothetical protein ABNQ39_05630 [Azospirillum sp. A26]|uniref:hypothetical protein n=1 Tax=Azospirillum sp. A26 TaxID=3160607 RepID=UPI00367087CF